MEFRRFMINVGIIGSGSWALALSKILINSSITIKARDINKAKKKFYKNRKLLIVNSFKSLMNSDIIFLANPSQTMRSVLKEMPKKINSKFVICSKGVEKNTNIAVKNFSVNQFSTPELDIYSKFQNNMNVIS